MDNLTQLQRDLLNCVWQYTRQKPITGKKIAEKIGLKERDTGKEGADLRSVVNAVRKKGYPVLANGRGYWYAQDPFELQEFIDSLRGRIAKMQEAVSGLVDADENTREMRLQREKLKNV